MKVVCAWCKKVLTGDATGGNSVFHGICPECLNRLVSAGPAINLRDLLDRLDFSVVVTDGSVTIQLANRTAEQVFGRTTSELENTDVGFAIECQHAQAGQCGRTEHCAGCLLRQTLQETYADGKPRYGVYSEHEVLTPEGTVPKRLRFSTTRVGDAVILAIEEGGELSTLS
jgi:PAS domain-containing protein